MSDMMNMIVATAFAMALAFLMSGIRRCLLNRS